ncbi:transporter [Diaphorobacter ruginosibacter]|uniref:Transporter n=1 Tax=Diaphorobacter ruginosibacter TaxID=1715720 RepID=A0A7G9RIB0_9BURK|nr:transporter [Diaphorobacter ruginosibacter]QNN55335.1 transporter [Diaphorobacter ruginosibacter]
MNKTIASAALTAAAALAPVAALAEGHYVPGVEGIQAASVPPPGLYYLGYLVNYDIGSFRAPGSSSNLPGHNTGTVTALANRVVWISNTKLLGADYGMEAIVPVMRTSLTVNAAGISDSRSGVGDIYVGPLVLGWHGQQWDAVAAAGIWLDNASTSHPASPGKGFKSTMLTGGATYHFDAAKTVTGSALMRFERNGRNDAGFRPGNQITMEWGLGKNFGTVQAGLVGYSQWQVSDDSGAGASTHRSSRHAVGAEVVYPIPSAAVFLKAAAYKEVRAEAGTGAYPKGSLVRFTIVKSF